VNVLFLVQVFVSALVIAAAVEAARRDPYWGADIIALPLTSVLAAGSTSIHATILPGAKLVEL